MVESDQVLSDASTFGLIRLKDRTVCRTIYNSGDLPTQIERVLHTDVHALTGLRRMGVHCVAGEEDAFVLGEVGADSLANLIGSPPVAIFVV